MNNITVWFLRSNYHHKESTINQIDEWIEEEFKIEDSKKSKCKFSVIKQGIGSLSTLKLYISDRDAVIFPVFSSLIQPKQVLKNSSHFAPETITKSNKGYHNGLISERNTTNEWMNETLGNNDESLDRKLCLDYAFNSSQSYITLSQHNNSYTRSNLFYITYMKNAMIHYTGQGCYYLLLFMKYPFMLVGLQCGYYRSSDGCEVCTIDTYTI